jgi:hypothetical protein
MLKSQSGMGNPLAGLAAAVAARSNSPVAALRRSGTLVAGPHTASDVEAAEEQPARYSLVRSHTVCGGHYFEHELAGACVEAGVGFALPLHQVRANLDSTPQQHRLQLSRAAKRRKPNLPHYAALKAAGKSSSVIPFRDTEMGETEETDETETAPEADKPVAALRKASTSPRLEGAQIRPETCKDHAEDDMAVLARGRRASEEPRSRSSVVFRCTSPLATASAAVAAGTAPVSSSPLGSASARSSRRPSAVGPPARKASGIAAGNGSGTQPSSTVASRRASGVGDGRAYTLAERAAMAVATAMGGKNSRPSSPGDRLSDSLPAALEPEDVYGFDSEHKPAGDAGPQPLHRGILKLSERSKSELSVCGREGAREGRERGGKTPVGSSK